MIRVCRKPGLRVGIKQFIMKKIVGIMIISLLFLSNAIKAQVTVEAFPLNPQSGIHNYFGVRVTLAQTYSEDVTVTGYIHDIGDPNTNHPFTLTVEEGNLTEETAANFYETDATASAEAVVGTIVYTYAGVVITYEAANNILKFGSITSVYTVLDQLEADYETYNDNYESQHSSLTEEELDSMDVLTSFDEFKPLRDFETLFTGYMSKRADIETIETAWLNSEFETADPDDTDLTFDDFENTIFNNDYSFKVGNVLYQLTSTGMYVGGVQVAQKGIDIYDASNISVIEMYAYDRQNMTKQSGPNIFFKDWMNSYQSNKSGLYDMDMFTECKSNKRKKAEPLYYANGTKRMDLKVAIHSIWVRNSVKAKAVHFKHKSGGGWKRSRIKMTVGCSGKVYNGSCGLIDGDITKWKPTSGLKNRKQLKVAVRSELSESPIIWKTFSGEIGGIVVAPSASISAGQLLTF